jgi:hypothetical protein
MRLSNQMSLRDVMARTSTRRWRAACTPPSTALLAMLPMAIRGGSAVESFAVPMVFGMVVAASSTVFIAAPILLFLGDWRKRHRRHRRKAPAMPDGRIRSPRSAGAAWLGAARALTVRQSSAARQLGRSEGVRPFRCPKAETCFGRGRARPSLARVRLHAMRGL